MKKRIRLTESDIRRIVKESVNSILKEGNTQDLQQIWSEMMKHILMCGDWAMQLYRCGDEDYERVGEEIGDCMDKLEAALRGLKARKTH